MLRLATSVFVVAGAATILPAQSCASGPPTTLGAVRVVNTSCPTGNLPRTTCRTVSVTCQGIPAIQAQVRVSEPDRNVALRGTIVFGTGGGGNSFYGDRTGGREVMGTLQTLGFRIVDRSWRGSWFGSRTSIRKQSCRYATLLTWIHQNIHTTGAFCATGNSGGSAELCYALSSWGRGAILDVAVPSGGPPMARLDYLCLRSTAWNTKCRSLIPFDRTECRTVACNVAARHAVCTGCTSNPTAKDLEADSILHPGATVSYPRTRVHLVIGDRDCGSAVPNAMLFYNAVRSEKVIEFPPGTPHWVAATAEGREAILRALLGGVACRPGSAGLRAMPKVGNRFELDVHGLPNKNFAVFVSTKPSRFELGGLGWLFLDAPIFQLGGGALGSNGRGTFRVDVPNDPGLAGLEFFNQLLTGTCLSNLVRVKIQP